MATTTDKNTNTTSKAKTTATTAPEATPAAVPTFETFTTRPAARKASGRAKSPLRAAIANLEVDQYINSGMTIAGLSDEDEKKVLASVRSKTGAESKDTEKKFTVFVAQGDANIADGSVIVGRTA